jgi:REP element-mobilizing transposase RayT
VPGGFYHVTLRGNHHERIFLGPSDRGRLNDITARALERTGTLLHAYCWMTNHLHLLVQVSERPLGDLMQRIGTHFARAVQRRVPITGHLFENRYHASLVDTDAYFLQLLCYIHLNPVRAGIVRRPALYPWSSHAEYAGIRSTPWVTITFGLRMFHADLSRAQKLYLDFLSRQLTADMDAEFSTAHGFETGASETPESHAVQPEQSMPAALERLACETCNEAGISLHELRSNSRAASIVRARDRLAAIAVERRVASHSEVARFLNRSVAAISRSAARHRRHQGMSI